MTTAHPTAAAGLGPRPSRAVRAVRDRLGPQWWRGPVAVTLVVAAALHVLWATVLASSGGDIAAQDAWAEFARFHPGTAYNLEWYGGIHTVSYSILSPYVMAWLGVRTTMVVVGTLASGLVAWLVAHDGRVRRPTLVSLYGALALFGDAVSGRVTFAMGAMFALVAVVLVVLAGERAQTRTQVREQTHDRRVRVGLRAAIAVTGAVATAASPVAGLFLGLIAAALWLGRRRRDAYALGLPPVAVVACSSLLFPFSGEEPMHWSSAILPTIVPVAVVMLVPREWRLVRTSCAVYVVAVLAAWLVPSPVGTNIERMGLLFGGTVLVAALISRGWERSWWTAWWQQRRGRRHPRAVLLLILAVVTATAWQVGVAGVDAVASRPALSTESSLSALVDQLEARHAELGRIEVVPTRSHREAAALAPYVALARGWNRQADVGRNPLFYKREVISPQAYHRWLKRWAVSYVVLGAAEPDPGARAEATLVASHPAYLHEQWTDGDWTLYSVSDTEPIVDAPARVTSFTPAVMTVQVPVAGVYTVRIPSSPWLALVDAHGDPLPDDRLQATGACLSGSLDGTTSGEATVGKDHPDWVVLHAPTSGTYHISAPYKLPRGSACADPD